ncbi:MAG: type II toxin-antitoxin system VapC family toxin [Treponema sp.]|nr:type II toxin-antitoxin system VapC family toxin [Treponema sp.]
MKAIYLLDTNVVSEFAKVKPNAHTLERYYENISRCAISATVWQELIYGVERMPKGKNRRTVENSLDAIRTNMEIIPYDSFAARICGELLAKCSASGTPSPIAASQIAATAIANNMILVTHNMHDFEILCKNSMLKTEDWWQM